jgi:hypothetical protein
LHRCCRACKNRSRDDEESYQYRDSTTQQDDFAQQISFHQLVSVHQLDSSHFQLLIIIATAFDFRLDANNWSMKHDYQQYDPHVQHPPYGRHTRPAIRLLGLKANRFEGIHCVTREGLNALDDIYHAADLVVSGAR